MRAAAVLMGVVATLGLMRGSVAGSGVIVAFDAAAGEFPEGIALDHSGDMYVSLAVTGEIRRIAEDGTQSTFHRFNPGTAGLGVLGLAATKRGTIYAAVPSNAPDAHGVWAITSGGEATRLPGSAAMVFPNGIARDNHGTLYVTDSISGAIWRIPHGGTAELWLADPLLAGTGALNGPGAPLGANGIALDRSRLLVANTDRKQVVEVPIDHAGAPGTPRVIHTFGGDLAFPDGIGADVAGNAYVLVAGENQLVRISRSGTTRVIADHDDGLNIPTSLAFGTRGTAKRMLFVTNFSLPPLVDLAGSGPPTPGIVAVDTRLPGPPLMP
ncbi:MAG: SMP-30/gluconolactonase/LRE family protein [Candidatus Limnocylindria bacterium]